MWDYYGGHMFGWGIFGWIMMIFVWLFPILLVIWILRELSGSRNDAGKSALDILKERYAKGEISKAEFESRKKDIEK